MSRLLIAGIVVCCGAVAFGAAPTQANMKLAWDKAEVDLGGGPAMVTTLLDFTTDGVEPYGVQGWSLGICIDKAKAKADASVLGADAAISKAGGKPDFLKVNVLADGVTCGVVIDFLGAEKVLAPKAAFKALDTTFSNVGLAAGESTLVKSCATLGSPPVIPVVVVDGASIPFGTAADLTLKVEGEPPVETKLELFSDTDCVAAVHLTTGAVAVDAVSFGVSNSANGDVVTIDRGAATADADFFGPKEVAGGATVGIVMSLDQPFTPLPASNDPAPIAVLTYANAGPAATITLNLSSALGDPAVDIVVTAEGGTDVEGVVIGGALELPCPVGVVKTFVRGDANQDNQINISDGVYIARYIFGLVNGFGCDDQMDANDDEQLNAGDPIYVLNYLFMGGAAMAAPVPADLRGIVKADCGPDAAGTALSCETVPPVCQ